MHYRKIAGPVGWVGQLLRFGALCSPVSPLTCHEQFDSFIIVLHRDPVDSIENRRVIVRITFTPPGEGNAMLLRNFCVRKPVCEFCRSKSPIFNRQSRSKSTYLSLSYTSIYEYQELGILLSFAEH